MSGVIEREVQRLVPVVNGNVNALLAMVKPTAGYYLHQAYAPETVVIRAAFGSDNKGYLAVPVPGVPFPMSALLDLGPEDTKLAISASATTALLPEPSIRRRHGGFACGLP